MDTVFTKEQAAHFRSLDAARLVAARFFGQKEGCSAIDYYRQAWPRSMSLSLVEKASVPAGTTASRSWAGPLAGSFPTELLSALVAAAAPVPVLPRLNLPRVPFQTRVAIDRADTSGVNFWVSGPGGSKVIVQNSFATATLPTTTVAGIFVLSDEMFEFSRPGSLEYLRDWLSWQATRFIDRQAFDPTVGPGGESFPASLTYGAPSIVATGQPADDIRALIAEFVAQGGRLESAAFVLSSENATALTLLDSDVFKLTITGGTIAGVPSYASTAIGDTIALIDRSAAALADDGLGNLTVSRHGTLLMSDTSVSPPTEAQQTSLWQTNSAAVKFERVIHWASAGGTVYMSRDYLTSGSPS